MPVNPPLRWGFTHPKPRNFGSGSSGPGNRKLGQEIVVRSEAVGAGLSVGQEGHAGAEVVAPWVHSVADTVRNEQPGEETHHDHP